MLMFGCYPRIGGSYDYGHRGGCRIGLRWIIGIGK